VLPELQPEYFFVPSKPQPALRRQPGKSAGRR
jgi:hypothetical protein